ncbi:MAG: hypothetical protein QOH75_2531 [Actinomycetota bacterium]|jgi:hypothetical protein|nr:hypothetical protein [Actinomycetota bacterium]
MSKALHPVGDVVVGLCVLIVHGRLPAIRARRDRGDVPGWVLVTIMTAGLVTALWLVADEKLRQLFNDALDGVVGNSP